MVSKFENIKNINTYIMLIEIYIAHMCTEDLSLINVLEKKYIYFA